MPLRNTAKLKSVVANFNILASTYGLPLIEHVNEASPTLLVALYESLKGVRLPITNRRDKSEKARARHFRILLRTISADMPSLNLSCIDLERICMGHKRHLCRLLELIIAIGQVITLNQSAMTDAEISAAQNCSTSTADLELSEAITDSASGIRMNSCENESDAISNDSSTTEGNVDICSQVLCSNTKQSAYTSTSPNIRKKRQSLVSVAARAGDRGSRTSKQCTQTNRAIRHPIGQKRGQRSNIWKSSRDSLDTQATPRRQQRTTEASVDGCICPKKQNGNQSDETSEVTMGRLSFLTDLSLPHTPKALVRAIVIDSPYTKYLKARRDLLMTGSNHQVSPLRPSPAQGGRVASPRAKWPMSIHRRATEYEPSHLGRQHHYGYGRRSPTRQQTALHGLMNSVGNSTNSDRSLYEDELIHAMY